MITKDKTILQEMGTLFQWSENTYKTYTAVLKNYTTFQNESMYELINEAENDEENIRKLSKRRIKKRLTNYQLNLQKQERTANTIKLYISTISKIYKYHDIQVPRLPPVKNNIQETFEDIPRKEEINKAILQSRTKMKALITFIASSGLRRSDVANLKIRDFIKATEDYHGEINNIPEFIYALEKKKMVIPLWNITSQKTHINHITFSSPESTSYILQMLKERLMKEDLTLEDSLFGIQVITITLNFEHINDRLGFGRKKTRRYFHPHSLRKFFATTLTANDVDYLSTQFMLGHSLSSVDSSYFFCNPDKLRNKYRRVLEHLTFNMKITYVDVTSDERRELLELRQFKAESDERIRKLEELINIIN